MNELEKEFNRLVREHRITMRTVCHSFAADDDEADDLMQEALVNLWRGLPAFRGESSERTWVWRVSLNTCIGAQRRRRTAPVPETLTAEAAPEAAPTTATTSGDDERQVRRLRQRIQRLGPFDRAIVLLWLEDMSYDEIAAIVGISVKNVSVRLFRIKEKLKKMKDLQE